MNQTTEADTACTKRPLHVPWFMPIFNAITRPLLAAGMPMASNGLLTVAGRRTGLPRTTPVAIIGVSGKSWVWAPWGDVQWVRNLRAAGRAKTTLRRREQVVRARELNLEERVAFFEDV